MRVSAIVLLMLVCLSARGQRICLRLEGGYGFYSMKSLTQHEAIPSGGVIPYKPLQTFPATPFIRAVIQMPVHDIWSTGLTFGYMRTGSRAAYSDYSGGAYRDVVVNGYQLGWTNSIKVYRVSEYDLSVRMNVGAIYNSAKFERNIALTAPAYNDSQVAKFQSLNPYGAIGGEISRKVRRFSLMAFVEYELNSPGDVKARSSNVGTVSPKEFDIDWSGMRIGLSCSIKLSKESHD